MANNQYRNKVIYFGETIMDISADTVTADKLAYGVTAHDKSGKPITGTNTYDADTGDATAVAAEILATKTAYVNGVKVTGSMPNRGAVNETIDTKTEQFTIPQGYHDGSGKVGINSTEQAKLIPENIRQGVTLLGVEGSMSGTEDVTAETVVLTPMKTAQTRTPSTGYNYIAQVTVNAVPYTETDNAAGGVTVTIG